MKELLIYEDKKEEGRIEGRAEGRIELILSLIREGTFTIESASQKFDIPIEELQKQL